MMKWRLVEYKWRDGYGYAIESPETDWYYVVSFLDDHTLKAANRVDHPHYVEEPEIKSCPSSVARRFIPVFFGDKIVVPNQFY